MKPLLLILAVLVVICGRGFAAEKPNILLIYTDDHGWADLGEQRVDADIRTPNLDQLVRDGVIFPRGYVSAPQCVPSRAGVITGRYQQRFGVEDNLKGPLPLSEVTLAERLKPAGYVSGWVGKSHLDIGGQKGSAKGMRILPEHMPHHQGFDEYFRGEQRQYFASHDLNGQAFDDAPRQVSDERFRVTVQTEAALSFLDRRAESPDQPWFLYLAWYAPHVPLESPEPWFSQTPSHLPKERRQALAMIAAMDDGIGKLREKLKQMNQQDNTLIFFIGDNGAPLKPGAWNGSLNGPLIGEKGMLTDGGIRVPFVAAWPGTIPGGQVYQHPVISFDVAATANALAGLPADPRLDGVNLIPFLTGQTTDAPHETLYWRWRSQAAVLEYPWKLIHLGDHERYLFNVTHPDGELAANNRLAEHPEIAARLEAKLKDWSTSLQPPGPPLSQNDQDHHFFSAHVTKTAPMPAKSHGNSDALAAAEVQGWLCRNGSLTPGDDGMIISPNADSARGPFLANSSLDLHGPVTLLLRVRAQSGGSCTASWRTRAERDFSSDRAVIFDWPASDAWRDVEVQLPVVGRLDHLRITPDATVTAIELQSIRLRDERGNTQDFDFKRQP